MRGYVLSVISVAFCGCIARNILPDGDGKNIKKAFSLIVTLLLILSVARPVMTFINSADGYDVQKAASGIYSSSAENYDKRWQETLAEVTSESLKGYISELLLTEFGLSDDNILTECSIVHEGDEINVGSIEITLIGKGMLINPRKIEALIEEKLGIECNVTEKWGEKNGEQRDKGEAP